jgi:hypothetical protein
VCSKDRHHAGIEQGAFCVAHEESRDALIRTCRMIDSVLLAWTCYVRHNGIWTLWVALGDWQSSLFEGRLAPLRPGKAVLVDGPQDSGFFLSFVFFFCIALCCCRECWKGIEAACVTKPYAALYPLQTWTGGKGYCSFLIHILYNH